jgi:hypothetical protein
MGTEDGDELKPRFNPFTPAGVTATLHLDFLEGSRMDKQLIQILYCRLVVKASQSF